MNERGLDLARALADWRRDGRFTASHPDHAAIGARDAIHTSPATWSSRRRPSRAAARGEPAITHVREALRRGCHVVTANKGPLAWAFADLSRLAAEQGLHFLYETTVMDGVPVLTSRARPAGRDGDAGRRDPEFHDQRRPRALERGGTFADAVARAQREGTRRPIRPTTWRGGTAR